MSNGKSSATLQILFRLFSVIGFLLILVGFGWAIHNTRFDLTAIILSGMGILLFLTLFLRAEISNVKYYLHVFVYSAVVFGICVVLYMFARQYTEQVDLTEQNIFSLSDESRRVLESLEEEVTVTAFLPNSNAIDDIRRLYSNETNKVKWEILDPVKNPMEARTVTDGQAAGYGTIFVASGHSTKRLSLTELQQNYENTLTNAIIEVTRATKPKIYFLTGHGEVAFRQPLTEQGRTRPAPTLAAFRKFLTDRAMETVELNLATEGNVPDDAALIVLAGPQRDLLTGEVEALREYLSNRHGSLLATIGAPQTTAVPRLDNLKALLGEYGVEVSDQLVVDLASRRIGAKETQPLVTYYAPDHEITKPFSEQPVLLIMDLTRPIRPAQAPPQIEVTELLRSSEASFAVDMAAAFNDQTITPPTQDQMSAQSLGVAAGYQKPPQMPPGAPQPEESNNAPRIVVFGSNDIIADSFLSVQQSAVMLMLNSVNWLIKQEDMIAIPSKQVEGTPIILTPAQLRIIFVLVGVAIPALLFFGGVSYGLLRRRR